MRGCREQYWEPTLLPIASGFFVTAVVLEPIHIGIVRAANPEREGYSGLEFWNGATINPSPEFRVTIRKGERARTVVIAGRIIHDYIGARSPRIISPHVHGEPAIV